MTSRELVIRTLNHETVDRIARDLWPSTRIETFHEDELAEMSFRYPSDIQKPDFQVPRGRRSKGTPGKPGRWTDAWGCTWQVTEPGTPGELIEPPLADLAHVAGYRPPLELFDKLSPAQVNRACAATPRFVLARTETEPWNRLQRLHGAEAARVDVACGNRAIRELLAMIHDYCCREIEWWAGTDVDGVSFQDQCGSLSGLHLGPDIWRDLLKPLYRRYCDIVHARDKFVFFHSGGNIAAILEDLVEIGIDAVDCHLFAMDFENLADRYRKRVTFWGGIDPQETFVSGTAADCRDAVRRIRKALDFGQGGVIAKCWWDTNIRFENVAAVFEEWCQPVPACF
jgi:uroporphyrinogen decarboxylase